jgi:hypothetical protein
MNAETGSDRLTAAVISFILSFVGFWCWMTPVFGIIICSISLLIGHYSRHAILPRTGKVGLIGRNIAVVGIFLQIFILYLIR